MTTIRPLERDDVPAVAELIRDNLPGWRRGVEVLERTLIEHPWTPSPPPTLVAVDDAGLIIGSIGAQERRMLFDGEPLRAVSVSHLVVDPRRRGGAAGALLVRALLSGGQDLTWTDSATEDVVRIWRTFGAHADHIRGCSWMLALRPGRWLARLAGAAVRPSNAVRRHMLPVRALPLQGVGRRLLPRGFPRPADGIAGEDATPAAIAEALPELVRGVRLRVAYDRAYLEWLAAHVGSLGSPLHMRLVRRGGRPIGWYAYIDQPGVSRLVHLAAPPREAQAVFDDLVRHCHEQGTAVLTGRLEPHLTEPVRKRLAAVGLTQRPLIHARDPELRAALASSESLLTEMDLIDSEWW